MGEGWWVLRSSAPQAELQSMFTCCGTSQKDRVRQVEHNSENMFHSSTLKTVQIYLQSSKVVWYEKCCNCIGTDSTWYKPALDCLVNWNHFLSRWGRKFWTQKYENSVGGHWSHFTERHAKGKMVPAWKSNKWREPESPCSPAQRYLVHTQTCFKLGRRRPSLHLVPISETETDKLSLNRHLWV